MRRAAIALVVLAGTALGPLAERQGYPWADIRGWLPDLLAGWVLIGLGATLLATSRERVPAGLLLAAGFTWFTFNFATTGPAPLGWIAARSAFVHRGALAALALVLAFSLAGRRAAFAVALAFGIAFAWPLWDNGWAALVLAGALAGVTAAGLRHASGRRRRTIAARALAAAAVLAAGIAADPIRSLADAARGVTDLTILVYAAAVAIAGVLLSSAAAAAAPSSLVDTAVGLERGGTRLRDVLRDLLGDPALELGFDDGTGALTADDGEPLAPLRPGLVQTRLVVATRPAGVIVHESGSLADGPTRTAVLAAAGLAAERARLRAEVERQASMIAASRRRLLLAEEDERGRLAATLDHGAGAALGELGRLVAAARQGAGAELVAALDRAATQVDRARSELDAIVRGLGGVEPAGLVRALEQLAADLPLHVELDVADVSLSGPAASTVWFVCAESLANAVKHAGARAVRVKLARQNSAVLLRIEDDGLGGADSAGSGLVGLADRVSAIGGTFTAHSPPGAGTRIDVELPAGGAE